MVEHALGRTTRIGPVQQTLEVDARQHQPEEVDSLPKRLIHGLTQQPVNQDRCALPRGICERIPGPVFELSSKSKDMSKLVDGR